MDRCGGEYLFVGEHQSPHEKCFYFPRETFVHALPWYGHMYGFYSEGCTKCKWRALPTRAPPAYHLYKMPMVQKRYTKAVEDSDMPKPQFNGQLESHDYKTSPTRTPPPSAAVPVLLSPGRPSPSPCGLLSCTDA